MVRVQWLPACDRLEFVADATDRGQREDPLDIAQMAGGKLKGLAIADDKRAAVAPNVPTYVELGYPRLAAASWVGFFAPAKVDPQIVATLNGAIDDIIRSPQVQKKLADMGFDPIIGSPAAAEAMFNGEVAKWGAMVKALDLSIK